MASSSTQPHSHKDSDLVTEALEQLNQVILGKQAQLKLALSCLLARGHLLIEDLPGVGKTTLAHAIAKVLGLHFQRVQFTSDLLPADILGVSVYDRDRNQFSFHPGAIFTQLLLADEINRATPKTQSALLEAMEERQVTVEGETRELPHPFFVIATQNPIHQLGTFPLPESQLDRFLMRVQLGYPDARAERALLQGQDRRLVLEQLQPTLDMEQLTRLQNAVPQTHASDALLDYLQLVLHHARTHDRYRPGLSPRAGLALLRSAQAWAFVEGRDYVVPDDLQAVLPAVVGHRLPTSDPSSGAASLAQSLLSEVPVP